MVYEAPLSTFRSIKAGVAGIETRASLYRERRGCIMAKRTVHMAVSGSESPWRVVGKVVSRAVSSDDYEFDLQTHPDLANARAVGKRTCEIGVTMSTYFDWAVLRL